MINNAIFSAGQNDNLKEYQARFKNKIMTVKKNYDGILLEEIRDSVKILAEGQIAMRDDISIIKSDVSTLRSDSAEFKDDTKQNFKVITDFFDETRG